MPDNVKRKVIKETDEYLARLEEFTTPDDDKILFIHVELKSTITKKLIEELRREFNEYKRKVKSAGYDNIYSYSATPKFYKLFKGYKELGPMGKGYKGYEVLRWELS